MIFQDFADGRPFPEYPECAFLAGSGVLNARAFRTSGACPDFALNARAFRTFGPHSGRREVAS